MRGKHEMHELTSLPSSDIVAIRLQQMKYVTNCGEEDEERPRIGRQQAKRRHLVEFVENVG